MNRQESLFTHISPLFFCVLFSAGLKEHDKNIGKFRQNKPNPSPGFPQRSSGCIIVNRGDLLQRRVL
ncbi:hypothetical protein L596_007224 [Steinernema carpocapsae]|uniref:Uncharacterized protein n=1 Tax=Steinernema carpocapsae TaxID=34508 RepID=A0A4U5P8L5_STECR|nr:hypothetical protein L596_007224 [Steinernema carpocapsae]